MDNRTVKGGWEKPHWWKWGIANIKSRKCARYFGQYIEGLEAGEAPQALIASFGKRAPAGSAFPLFGLLPYEIRAMIWKYALKSQKSEVRIKFSHDTEFGHLTNIKISNQNCLPSFFHVNSESRKFALKDYELVFGTKHNPANTYLNKMRDRVFIHTKNPSELAIMARYISAYDASRIRHLVLPFRDFIKGDEMLVSDSLPW